MRTRQVLAVAALRVGDTMLPWSAGQRARRAMGLTALALYLIGLGFLGGMLIERLRFDAARGEVLAHYTEATSRLRHKAILLEGGRAAQRQEERAMEER